MPAAISRPHRLISERLQRDLEQLEQLAARLAHPQSTADARAAAELRVDVALLERVGVALADALDDGRQQDPTDLRADLVDLHCSVARLVAAVGPEPAPRQERRTA